MSTYVNQRGQGLKKQILVNINCEWLFGGQNIKIDGYLNFCMNIRILGWVKDKGYSLYIVTGSLNQIAVFEKLTNLLEFIYNNNDFLSAFNNQKSYVL